MTSDTPTPPPAIDTAYAPKLDDDVFAYDDSPMTRCISGFGRNAIEAIGDDLDQHMPGGEEHTAARERLTWHIEELVRWCRHFNGKSQRQAESIRVVSNQRDGFERGLKDLLKDVAALKAENARLRDIVDRIVKWDIAKPKGRVYPIGPNDPEKQFDCICADDRGATLSPTSATDVPASVVSVEAERQYAFPLQASSPFGVFVAAPVPQDCNVVILCTNEGYGFRPLRVLLPHQVYTEVIEQIIAEHPSTKQVTLIPARSSEYLDLFAEWGELGRAGRVTPPAATPEVSKSQEKRVTALRNAAERGGGQS